VSDVPEGSVEYVLPDDGVAVVTIRQPRRRNAMTYPMMAEMFEAFRAADADPRCRVVILTGAEGTFCSGIDLVHLRGIPPGERGFRGRLHDDDGWWNIASVSVPVVAAIDGDAVGMGAEWTSMCDVRVATTRARFAWNFVHRGLVPDTGAGTWLLPRLVGVQQAMRLLMSGDFWSAQEAHAAGYVGVLVEPDRLLEAAHEVAAGFLRGLPGAQARTKRLVYDGLDRGVLEHQQVSRAQLLECFASEEHAAALARFTSR
jgi:enoyl-CoA hydratase/carnithine racemase